MSFAPNSDPNAPLAYSASWLEPINEDATRQYLKSQQFPPGLMDYAIRGMKQIPIRFFICDDSGSMGINDGHRNIKAQNTIKRIQCSRWNEMTEELRFLAGLTQAAQYVSEFRFLNNRAFRVERNSDLSGFYNVLEQSPNGLYLSPSLLNSTTHYSQSLTQYVYQLFYHCFASLYFSECLFCILLYPHYIEISLLFYS